MKPKKKLNVRLLRRIQKHILEEPRRFIMEVLVENGHAGEIINHAPGGQTFANCGTAACIAGWAVLLTQRRKMKRTDQDIWNKAVKLINPPVPSGLFLESDWPRRFLNRYANAKTPLARAKIACARIDHLIKTGK